MSFLSILAVKSSASLLRLAGRGGSLPGTIGLKLDPDSLNKLLINGPVILVTGTNGKTSTANMIASAFEAAGYSVISNRKGDNLRDGITTTLLSAADFSGHIQDKAIVLEVDELNIRHILPKIPVSALVVGNFFRDQLDRAREMDQLIESIESVLPDFKGTLILNGNDPNTLRLSLSAPQAKKMYFGIEKNQYSVEKTNEASEGKFCPKCGHRLEYDYYQYSHIGSFHCPNCDFRTPELDVCLKDISLEDHTFHYGDHLFKGPYEGMYSMYNYAALLSVARLFHLDNQAIEKVFAHAPVPFGRNERFEKNGHTVILNLIKNPTGANEVMKVIEQDPEDKNILIVLNDHEQDGRDVSWIYDTYFEKVMTPSTKAIWTAGSRSNDIALRLYYGGWNGPLKSDASIDESLKQALEGNLPLYVIATYTALVPTRNAIIKEVEK